MEKLFAISITVLCMLQAVAQDKMPFKVIGYYSGPSAAIESYPVEKLTHLIFCFGSLKGNRFNIVNADDSITIKKMVALKKRNPSLKVLLSLGGWGNCTTCSDAFNTEEGRREFAQSVKSTAAFFKADGIDLDWEYPAVAGYPGHTYRPADKENFTELLKELRVENGNLFTISFAAGGLTSIIDSSIEWKEAMKFADFVNLMSYDLVHGYSTTSGHHTPLYSTEKQKESVDNGVQLLLKHDVAAEKIIIGAAFYGRIFGIDDNSPVDLYSPCKFKHNFAFKNGHDALTGTNGFEKKWDDVAKAPYSINIEKKLMVTYDDRHSLALKRKYALEHKLGGIMFWQLWEDTVEGGLLEVVAGE